MWSQESQTIATWIGATAQVLIVLSLFILWRQANASREQINSSKKIHESESLIDTFRFLTEIRDQIEHIIDLEHKDFSHWNDADRRAAVIVCNRFNMLGALIEEKIVPLAPVATCYFYSIPKTHRTLLKYIASMRNSRSNGYWKHFDYLNDEVVKYNMKIDHTVYSHMTADV